MLSQADAAPPVHVAWKFEAQTCLGISSAPHETARGAGQTSTGHCVVAGGVGALAGGTRLPPIQAVFCPQPVALPFSFFAPSQQPQPDVCWSPQLELPQFHDEQRLLAQQASAHEAADLAAV